MADLWFPLRSFKMPLFFFLFGQGRATFQLPELSFFQKDCPDEA